MIKAVFFDLDNTIVHSENSRFISLNLVLSEFNVKISKEEWDKKYKRLNSVPIFEEIKNNNNLNYDSKKLYEKSSKIREKIIEDKGIEIIKGFNNFLDKILKKGIKIIIVSGGTRKHIKKILQKCKLNYLNFLGREDYKNTKPSPDCYIKALEVLNVNSNEALVIDDSYNGMKAGIDAGCRVIGINCMDEKGIEKLNLLLKVEDYTQIDLEKFLK